MSATSDHDQVLVLSLQATIANERTDTIQSLAVGPKGA